MATQNPQAKTAVRATPAKAAKPAVKPAAIAAKTPVKPAAKVAVKKAAAPAKAKIVKKTAVKAVTKSIAPALKKPLVPVAKAAVKAVAKTEKKAEIKIKKIKQVRDSFTMPETEYEVLSQVKKACLKAGFEIKKSDLLRIGVSLIKNLETGKLKTLLAGLTPLKVGRPKK